MPPTASSLDRFNKAENRILRHKLPKQFTITSKERSQLLNFGKPFGGARPLGARHRPTLAGRRSTDEGVILR